MFTIHHQNIEGVFDSDLLSNEVDKLGEQDVHLWRVHRNVYNEFKNYSEYFLNEDEQHRAKRFRFRKHHDLFVIGRYVTKVMLAHYAGCTPESVDIVQDSFGKPACEMNIFFNISHSDDQLLVGFSNSEIGVDIERVNSTVNFERIGKNHFSEVEVNKIMEFTEDERADTFFEIWTKKESVIKGIGKGLGIPLQDFNITDQNGQVLWKSPTENDYGAWFAHNIEIRQGFKTAFATQKKVVDLRYFCCEGC